MKRPIIQLNACEYNKLGSNTPVLNRQQLDYFTWIYLDPELVSSTTLYEGYEILNSEPYDLDICALEFKSRCWIQCTTELLNLKPGKHTYKLLFVDVSDNTTFSLYVSYIIQDDNPDKPYLYMNRDSSTNA